MKRRFLILTSILACTMTSQAQFNLLNNAVQLNDNTWRLTSASLSQKGQMWHEDPIDLKQDFEIHFRINLGTSVTGGDGVTFTMQTSCLSEGGHASAMGVVGIEPAVSLEFDTYFNSSKNDPDASHIALFKNGDNFHGSENQLSNDVGSNNVSVNNMENGVWRDVIVTWTAATQTFAMNYSGFDLLSHSSDLINNVFDGSSAVYWGFTGSTGGSVNVQRVQMIEYPDNQLTLANATICPGDSVQSGFILDGTYTWQGEGISDPSAPQPWFSPEEDTEYLLSFEDSCGNISNYSFTVFVEPAPQTTISVPEDPIICAGSTTEISADLTPGQSIQWFVDGEPIADAENSIFQAASAGEYFALVSNDAGCESVTNSIDLELVQPPNAELAIDSDQACPGVEVTLTADLEVGETAVWLLNDNVLDGVSGDSHTTETPGEYTILVTNFEGCSNLSDPVSFSHYDLPNTSEISGNVEVLCDEQDEVYEVEPTPGSEYNWTVPEGAEIVSGQSTHSITVDFNENFGIISVTETNEFGCPGETVNLEVSCLTVSISENELPSIRVYPNPARDVIQFGKDVNGHHLIISDMKGKMVLSQTVKSNQANISQLANGMYLGSIQNENQQFYFRILKQ